MAISDDTVVVGARLEDSNATGIDGDQSNNSASASGAAYVFSRSGTTWSQQAYLKASNADVEDDFGNSVAISGETMVVSAVGEGSNATGVNGDQSNNSAQSSGAAYVFDLFFTIGGNVSGLTGSGLVLQDNGDDDLEIAADGNFTFDTPLEDGSDYAVTVLTQPTVPGQTCGVTNDSGTLSGADITNVQVTCVTNTYTIGGNVSGLAGTGLVLQNNGGDDLPRAADGSFTFTMPLEDGSDYVVTVLTQPTHLSQTCTVTNDSGTLAGANVTDVSVNYTQEGISEDGFEDLAGS